MGGGDGASGDGAYLPSKKSGENLVLFFSFFFLMCLTIRGNEFKFFQHKRAINRARRTEIDPKIGTFCRICRIGIRDYEKGK